MTAEQARARNFERMTTEPVPGLILKLSVPSVISMLITSLYNMADTYFVSQLGTEASGAVGIVFALMAFIQAIGYCLSTGSGSYTSRLLGAQDNETAAKVMVTAAGTAFLFGVALAVVGCSFPTQLVRLLGATPTIEPYAKSYASIILIGAPYMAATFVLNNALRSQGKSKLGTIGMSTGAIVNVILDPIFIFVLDFGIMGAALATIISQLIGFFTLLTLYRRSTGLIPLKLRNFTPKWSMYKEILKIGQSSLYRQALSSISTICINHFAAPYGDAAIAALSIVSRCFNFAMSVVYGIGHAFQPVCGYSYGAKLYQRVRQGFWFCVKISTAFLFCIALFGFVFAPQILHEFRPDDPVVISIGAFSLRALCCVLPFMGWLWPNQQLLQSLGLGWRSALLSVMQQGACFLVYIVVLSQLFGLTGIQISLPLSLFTTCVVCVPLCWNIHRCLAQGRDVNSRTKDPCRKHKGSENR